MTDMETREFLAKGFKKVAEDGGTYVVAKFFNPTTNEVVTECTRDYDYADGSRDNDILYYLPIDEDARKLYDRYRGVINVGDTAEVIKGRKVPIGTKGVVKYINDLKDKYGRWIATYVYFEDGQKTNIANCKLV